MKILRLRFHNINSLKGDFTIDFTTPPLATTGIFAIIGPTGSGKSTILDAITLALYNRTPRTGSVSKNQIENFGSVITQNTDSCFTEVEYEVNGKSYRSKWEISRARTGNLRDYEMELAELPDNKLIDVKKYKIPEKNAEIIGLNYDQFVKSILLSQGEFAKFLKADANERGELLEKITGTEIYRQIGKATFEKNKEEKQKLDTLKLKNDSVKLLTEEEITQNTEYQNELERSLIELNAKYNQLAELKKIKEALLKQQTEKTKLEKLQQQIIIDIEQFKPELAKLEKHEKLFSMKADMIELQGFYKNEKQIAAKIFQAESEIEYLTISVEKLKKLVAQQTEKKLEFEQDYEQTKPILKQVKELDNQISIQKSLITEESKNLKLQKEELAKIEAQRNETSQKLETAKADKIKQIKWRDDNKIAEDLSQELSLIKEKISLFENEKKNADKSISQLKTDVKDKVTKAKKWDEKQAIIETSTKTTVLQIAEIENKCEFTKNDLKLLGDRKDALLLKYNAVSNQKKLSDEFQKKNQILLEYKSLIDSLLQQLQTNKESKQKTEHETEILNKLVEELKIRLERQTLEAKYNDDRLKLKANEPCYLCGSEHHPYVKNYSSSLNSTQKELKTAETSLKTHSTNIQKFTTEIAKFESEQTNATKQIATLTVEIDKITKDFNRINEENHLENRFEKPESFDLLLNEIKKDGEKIRLEIQQLELLKELENDKQNLEIALEKVAKTSESTQSIRQYYQKYSKYLGSEVLEKASTLLTTALNEYARNKEQLNQFDNQIESNEKLLNDRIQQFEKKQTDLKLIESEFKKKSDEASTTQNKRIQLFSNKIPDQVEEKFQSDIKKITAEISKLDIDIAATNSKMNSLLTNNLTLKEEKQQIDSNISTKEQLLLPNLNVYGYKSIDEALKNILTDETVEKIKAKQTSLEQNKYSNHQSINEKQNEITEIEKTDNQEILLNEVNGGIEESKQMQQQANQNIGMIKSKLAENEVAKKAKEGLLAELQNQEKAFTRWDTLNRLIGDAEGKKFSKFAQELTLLQLISLANTHLKSLNKRYFLKKGDVATKEELVVVDGFLGNTQRSVQTLSGGESFLLSLALALGLSDLAGKNTKIESLFIDEGFGSLDQETLDVALSALENLQSQTNRTIGIISHVQQLKERITTKIELVKANSGHSVIVIN